MVLLPLILHAYDRGPPFPWPSPCSPRPPLLLALPRPSLPPSPRTDPISLCLSPASSRSSSLLLFFSLKSERIKEGSVTGSGSRSRHRYRKRVWEGEVKGPPPRRASPHRTPFQAAAAGNGREARSTRILTAPRHPP